MEQDFKNKFQHLIEKTSDILIAMFGFGLWKGNKLFFTTFTNLNNPIKDKLKSCWDERIFLDSILALDPKDEEGTLYSKDGISYNLFQLEKAIKFNRPPWVYFYLIAHLLGEIIENEYSVDDFQIYLNSLPTSFKKEYGEKIVYLVNYFGEKHNLLLNYIDGKIMLG